MDSDEKSSTDSLVQRGGEFADAAAGETGLGIRDMAMQELAGVYKAPAREKTVD